MMPPQRDVGQPHVGELEGRNFSAEPIVSPLSLGAACPDSSEA